MLIGYQFQGKKEFNSNSTQIQFEMNVMEPAEEVSTSGVTLRKIIQANMSKSYPKSTRKDMQLVQIVECGWTVGQLGFQTLQKGIVERRNAWSSKWDGIRRERVSFRGLAQCQSSNITYLAEPQVPIMILHQMQTQTSTCLTQAAMSKSSSCQ